MHAASNLRVYARRLGEQLVGMGVRVSVRVGVQLVGLRVGVCV